MKVKSKGEARWGRWQRAVRAGKGANTPGRVFWAVFLLVFGLSLTVTGCGEPQSTSGSMTTTSSAAKQRAGGSGSGQPPWFDRGSSTTVVGSDGADGRVTSTTATSPQTGNSPVGSAGLASTTTTTLPPGTYSDGIYLVGTDIASGLYKGVATSATSHWEISWDANGERFVAGGDPVGQFYVKVASGQYLSLTGAIVGKAPTTAAENLATSDIGDGTYRVGYDIAAGWYKGAPTDSMGYWQITSDANGQSVVATDYVKGPFTLKVKSGQYLTLRGVSVRQ